VEAVRRSIEAAAKLPEGRTVRWLALGSRELRDEELLQDVGISCAADLLAICAEAIVGDFEAYVPGCPTCDFGGELQRVRFLDDGTALIQSRPHEQPKRFSYTLGELCGNTRHLCFVEDGAPSSQAYAGTLEASITNHLNRRVRVPELDIDVHDVRYRAEQGRSYVQMKMRLLMDHYKGQLDDVERCFWMDNEAKWFDNEAGPDNIDQADEAQIWEATARAWNLWRQAYEDERDAELQETHAEPLEAKRGKQRRPRRQQSKKPRWLLQEERLEAARRQALRRKRQRATHPRHLRQGTLRWPQLL
jgi:hypothetical protein